MKTEKNRIKRKFNDYMECLKYARENGNCGNDWDEKDENGKTWYCVYEYAEDGVKLTDEKMVRFEKISAEKEVEEREQKRNNEKDANVSFIKNAVSKLGEKRVIEIYKESMSNKAAYERSALPKLVKEELEYYMNN